jgi:EAL domain-containing protein (putative c-di-GMP-specific phosphodiesterase class I)
LFEKSGQIGLLDKFVWEETARIIARWRELYGVTIPVSVNLSRVDVFDPTLEATLEEILHTSGLTPDAFKLEITESAYTENAEQLIRVVESLRNKGYEISIDDFGTGYSSLNMLSAMPVDVLKMDRRFVRNVTRDKMDIQMVALVMDIARNLGIPVIAEGVETKEQLGLLKDLGCAYAQGYYFSRPIPTPDFEAKYVRTAQADKVES